MNRERFADDYRSRYERSAVTRTPPKRIGALRLLARTVLVFCVSLSVIAPDGCGGGASEVPPDCLPNGTELCGPPWDSDGDTISTNTELSPVNYQGNGGYYDLDTLAWDMNESQARGLPTDGYLHHGMNLWDIGDGYQHHLGTDVPDTDDWGTGCLLRLIEGAGRIWDVELSYDPLLPIMQVGDLSLKDGGYWSDHPGSHRNGLDVDVRYLGKNGYVGPLDICLDPDLYDQSATAALIEYIIQYGDGYEGRPTVTHVFVDDQGCHGLADELNRGILQDWPGHADHFHVRIEDPDGSN